MVGVGSGELKIRFTVVYFLLHLLNLINVLTTHLLKKVVLVQKEQI